MPQNVTFLNSQIKKKIFGILQKLQQLSSVSFQAAVNQLEVTQETNTSIAPSEFADF